MSSWSVNVYGGVHDGEIFVESHIEKDIWLAIWRAMVMRSLDYQGGACALPPTWFL